jgi:hypothetical protein
VGEDDRVIEGGNMKVIEPPASSRLLEMTPENKGLFDHAPVVLTSNR